MTTKSERTADLIAATQFIKELQHLAPADLRVELHAEIARLELLATLDRSMAARADLRIGHMRNAIAVSYQYR